MKTKSVLIDKSSEEHERYFQAFLERRILRQQTQDMFGTTREIEAEVHSVEHAGDRTQFVLVPYKSPLETHLDGAGKTQPRDTR